MASLDFYWLSKTDDLTTQCYYQHCQSRKASPSFFPLHFCAVITPDSKLVGELNAYTGPSLFVISSPQSREVGGHSVSGLCFFSLTSQNPALKEQQDSLPSIGQQRLDQVFKVSLNYIAEGKASYRRCCSKETQIWNFFRKWNEIVNEWETFENKNKRPEQQYIKKMKFKK